MNVSYKEEDVVMTDGSLRRREKILPVEKAQSFLVSKWTVYRLVGQKRKTGSVALRTSQRGRKPVLTERDLLRICGNIAERTDITVKDMLPAYCKICFNWYNRP